MAIDKNKAIANAQRFTQKGQLDRALKEYQAIVAEDPDDVRIWLKIGDLFTKKGTVPQAVSTYARVAVYYSERGFFLKAVAVWKQILNIDPTYVDAHLKLAELYVQLGLAPDAIGQYQLVVGAYEREGRHRDSVGLLKKIVELAPDDVPNRIRLAEAFARQNDNSKAVEEFKVVLEQLHQRERWDEAIQVGERVAYLAPDDIENLRLVSEVYLRRGDARRALARLQACFKAQPTDVPTLELLARAFTELGQTQKAISVHRELARLHEEAENPTARLEAFRRILALDPTDVEAISATGGGRPREPQRPLPQNALFTQGITSTQGMQRLGAVAQPVEVLTPEDQVRRHLADIDLLLKYGLGEHALQTTDKILSLEAEHQEALVKRKDIAIAIGRRDEAIASILKLATIAERNNPEAAMTWLGEALQISPHHNEANQRMQRLSSGMAAGLRRTAAAAAPQGAVIEVAQPDDYPDLDLGALDFGDEAGHEEVSRSKDGRAASVADLELEFDAGDLLGNDSAMSIEASAEDDFGGLNDAADDDFLDLLSGEQPPEAHPAAVPAQSVEAQGGEDDFGGLLGDDGPDELPTPSPSAPAEGEEDFGGLLVGPRLSNPGAPTPIGGLATAQFRPEAPPTPARGMSLPVGLGGAPTPQPLADDFGDLGPMDLPDDDFSDLLSDEVVPSAAPSGEAAPDASVQDEMDFGDLLGSDLPVEPASEAADGDDDEPATPVPAVPPDPASLFAAPPAPAPIEAAGEMDLGDLLPEGFDAPAPTTDAVALPEEGATDFGLGDLLPADLQGALDAAERAAAPTPAPGALTPEVDEESDEPAVPLMQAAPSAMTPAPAPAPEAELDEIDFDVDASDEAPGPTIAIDVSELKLDPDILAGFDAPRPVTAQPVELSVEDEASSVPATGPTPVVEPEAESIESAAPAAALDEAGGDLAGGEFDLGDFEVESDVPVAVESAPSESEPALEVPPALDLAALLPADFDAADAAPADAPEDAAADSVEVDAADFEFDLNAPDAEPTGGPTEAARLDAPTPAPAPAEPPGPDEIEAWGAELGAEAPHAAAPEDAPPAALSAEEDGFDIDVGFDDPVGIDDAPAAAAADASVEDAPSFDLPDAAAPHALQSVDAVEAAPAVPAGRDPFDLGDAFGLDDDFAAEPEASGPEIEEAPPEHAVATAAVTEAIGALHIADEEAPAPPAATPDVLDALGALRPTPAPAPVAAAVSEAFEGIGDDEDEDEDQDRTVFAAPETLTGNATATPNARAGESAPARAAIPISFSPAPSPRPALPTPAPLEEGPVDVEMEMASLPGVDMGLADAEALEPIEEIDDIELLDDELDVIEDDDAAAAAEVPGDAEFDLDDHTEGPPPPRRPMIDARTVVASVDFTDIEDELAEVDFLIESNLAADAREAVEDLASVHGIGHPAIQARINRILEIESVAREAERAVAFMGATEPTPATPLAASSVEELSEADVAAHFDLGVAYMEMGQYKKAIAQLQRVAHHRERRAEALRVIALCELQQGDAASAVKHLEDALAVPGLSRDGRVGLLYDLATAYETLGNRIAARTQLKGILDLGAGDFLDTRERLQRLSGA